MLNKNYLSTLMLLLCISCSGDETVPKDDFSGIIYEYVSENPMTGVEIAMSAGVGVPDLSIVGTTITNDRGLFLFNPDNSSTIMVYNYAAQAKGFEIKPANENLVAFLNTPPNYDTLIAYEDAYLTCIVNPVDGINREQLVINFISDEFSISRFSKLIFEDADEIQSGVVKFFKTKEPITAFWIIDGESFQQSLELQPQDTITLTIGY